MYCLACRGYGRLTGPKHWWLVAHLICRTQAQASLSRSICLASVDCRRGSHRPVSPSPRCVHLRVSLKLFDFRICRPEKCWVAESPFASLYPIDKANYPRLGQCLHATPRTRSLATSEVGVLAPAL